MKKLLLIGLLYLVCIIIVRFIFIPEKYIYGHNYNYKFLEFLSAVIIIPFTTGLAYIAKTANKEKSIGIVFLFVLLGFSGLMTSALIEKTIAHTQLNNEGKITLGFVKNRYIEKRSSKSSKKTYNFIVSFKVKDSAYYSLPGFTDEEIYKIGDTITVRYLERTLF